MTWKNLLRLLCVVFALVACFWLSASWTNTLIGTTVVWGMEEFLVVAIAPNLNVQHNVHKMRKAAIGYKISVVPWTAERLNFYQWKYIEALGRVGNVRIAVDSDNTITLEKVA